MRLLALTTLVAGAHPALASGRIDHDGVGGSAGLQVASQSSDALEHTLASLERELKHLASTEHRTHRPTSPRKHRDHRPTSVQKGRRTHRTATARNSGLERLRQPSLERQDDDLMSGSPARLFEKTEQEELAQQKRAVTELTDETPHEDVVFNRTLFLYWSKPPLPPMHLRCVDNFRRYNPTWSVALLSEATAPILLGRSSLPRTWEQMTPTLQSDAVRLAALRQFGGAWIDITSMFVRKNALDSMWKEMLEQGRDLRGYTTHDEHVFESWFIMAASNSVLMAQWHDMFLTYYESRSASTDIVHHDLFAQIAGQKPFKAIEGVTESSCEDCPNYLSIHVCFLRVQALSEWSDGSWQQHVLLERSNERGGYYVQGTLCGAGFCNCKDASKGGHYKGDECTHDVFWGDTPAEDIAEHTPFVKLSARAIAPSMGLETEEQVLNVFDEHPSSLLAQLLQRDPPPLSRRPVEDNKDGKDGGEKRTEEDFEVDGKRSINVGESSHMTSEQGNLALAWAGDANDKPVGWNGRRMQAALRKYVHEHALLHDENASD